MIPKKYADFAWEQAETILNIDSPTGYTAEAAAWVKEAFEKLGFAATITTKGGVLADLGGKGEGLLLAAHADTLGGMVAQIKGNGRLKITALGGMNANNAEAENVRVRTREGKVIEGTLQLCNASIHVNPEYNNAKRTFDTTEVVLDAEADSAEAVKKLGIQVGDIVCFAPRTRRTESGYLKSRFLDDKLSVGILLGFAKYVADEKPKLSRHVYVHITVYEEVGHGGSGSVPEGVTEAISVDMGCVGNGLACTEKQVSICVKDSGGPYSYEVVGKLLEAAKKAGADYAADVYPMYGSDVEATLRSGYDIRHGLIGPGVYASHGYERSHIDGVYNTLKLLSGYLEELK
ncbi:MAG: M42 family metallopeptidase [Oscillospiraceae bacterium]|nr:M42 family metallopeptidase [Oscillospiraceae bacterium]